MKLKTTLLALLTCLCVNVFAKDATCSMIVPFAAGGGGDINARVLQKGNKNIVIEYKPGAFAAAAVNHINNNPDSFMLAPLVMFGADNPNKDVNVDVLRVMYGIDLVIVSNREMSVDDLVDKKLNIGIPYVGTTQHIIALQFANKNKQMELIPMGGDTKALPALVSKDLDAYITNTVVAKQWIKNYPQFHSVVEIPFDKKVFTHGITLENYLFQGIIISKFANKEQKQKIEECIDTATSAPEFKQEIANLNIKVVNSDATKVTAEYHKLRKKYGF